jgi:hypothetical protein
MTAGHDDQERLRPLPFRPRPQTGESTDTYIRRLAQANHLKPSYLRGYLAGPPEYSQGRPRADRLAALTGRDQDALERALTDLAPRRPAESAQPDKPKRHVTLSADKPALFAAIRQDAREKHLSVGALSRRHHVHTRTVLQALASPTPPPRKPRTVHENPVLDRVRPALDTILDEYAALHGGQLPTTRLVWERLLDEHDANVSYGTIHRYMSNHPLKDPSGRRAPGSIPTPVQHNLQTSVIRHYRGLLTAVHQQPQTHGIDNTYPSVTAFILGCDAGSSWGMLTGFKEWLVVRLGKGHDLAWPILVRHLTITGWIHPLTPQSDAEAVTTLFQLLAEFMDQREQPNGLAKIFKDHQTWLNTQAWYHFETPSPDHTA